ncbi:hypothetical protein, conserved, partial [Babesia bigemina]
MSHHVHPNSKSLELPRLINAMTSINLNNNLALKDIDSKLISLGHLAGQLGGFVGQSESVKKAVVNAIKAYFDNNPSLKNDLKDVYSSHVTKLSVSDKSADQADDTVKISELSQLVSKEIAKISAEIEHLEKHNNLYNHSPPSLSPSADSAKLQSKLEALKKVKELCGFYENSNNQQNEPKNLLDNLCDGLQTFLGFDPNSKGYTGDGIVYSDLDRLCDGVMGFLSGVLKDVSDKQPYKVGRDILETLLRDIKNNLSTGREGFKVIAQVADRVREHNESVKESNKKVSDPIEKLQGEMKNLTTTGHDFTTENERVGEQLQKFKKHAEAFCGSMRDAEKNILDLNNDCRTKVNSALKIVTRESAIVHRFSDKAREDLDRMMNAIKTTLDELNTRINIEVRNQVSLLVEALKDKVTIILQQVKKISKTLSKCVVDLDHWIIAACKICYQTEQEVETILGEVNDREGSDSNNRNGIQLAVKALQKKISELHNAGNKALDNVRNDLGLALATVVEMDGHLKGDLYNVKNEIKKAIWQHVKENVVKHYDTLKDNTERGQGDKNKESIEYNWAVLKTAIAMHTREVYEHKATNQRDGYLGMIAEAIKKYVKKLAAEKAEEKILPGWIDRFFEKDSICKHYVALYVKEKTANGVNAGLNEEAVMGAIKPKIIGLVEDVKIDTSITDDATVETMLNTIHKFHSDVAGAIEKGVENKKADEIVAQIEQTLNVNGRPKSTPDPKDYLKYAIEMLLLKLPLIVRKTAEGIKALTSNDAGYNLGKNLDKAMKQVDYINQQLKGGRDDQESFGKKIDTAFTKIRHQITQLNNTLVEETFNNAIGDILNQQIGTDGKSITVTHLGGRRSEQSTADIRKNIKGFTEYKKYVEGVSLKDGLKGKLPDVINEMKINVEKALNDVGKVSIKAGEELEELDSKFNQLCIAICNAGTKIKSKLSDLKTHNIIDKLKKIKEELHSLRNVQLWDAIKTAESFINVEADNLKQKYVNELQNYVSTNIHFALSTLSTAARRNYVSSVKQLLTAFADKVSQELAELPGEIERDLQIGFKGLMRVMGGVNSETGEPVEGSGTPSLLDKINTAVSSHKSGTPIKDTFTKLSDALKNYYDPIHKYIKAQINTKNPPEPEINRETTEQNTKHLDTANTNFEKLLTHLKNDSKPSRTYIFDNKFTNLHSSLSSSLSLLSPSAFANPRHPELLDAVKKGLDGFVEQMGRVYVNGYDDGKPIDWNTNKLIETKSDSENSSGKEKLTPYGEKLSKVFLSTIQVLFQDFWELYKECVANKSERIRLHNKSKDGVKLPNALGAFLAKRGYKVPTEEDKQDGELQNKDKTMTGENIKALYEKLAKNQKTPLLRDKGPSILYYLYEYLKKYYEVCHLEVRSSTKHPANSYQMLQWLAGLRWSPVFYSLRWYLRELFPTPDQHKGKPRDKVPTNDLNLAATSYIRAQQLVTDMLPNVCLHSQSVLTAIMGHGHAGGRYAVDFYTNAENLSYPSRGSDCFDLLVDILERLYHQFRFLYSQCENDTDSSGWADCWYGRGVGGSSWNCNTKQCPNQNCPQLADQNAGQRANQSADQTCDSHPKCGLKSPLQSFLEDGLPGFLPHQFKKPGCKLDCSTANHRGIPCKTPMGFSDISQLASHTKTGADLRKILRDFCGRNSHLRSLCACLMCLLQKPPQTLGDMFAFYYNFIDGWNLEGKQHKQMAFEKAMAKANFGIAYKELEIHTLFSSSHSAVSTGHTNASLGSLVCTSMPSAVCGPYLSSISHHISGVFSEKNADKYMSWVVYLTESFYDLLKKLFHHSMLTGGQKDQTALANSGQGCPNL